MDSILRPSKSPEVLIYQLPQADTVSSVGLQRAKAREPQKGLKLLVTKGIATNGAKDATRGAPGLTTMEQIATRSKDAIRWKPSQVGLGRGCSTM